MTGMSLRVYFCRAYIIYRGGHETAGWCPEWLRAHGCKGEALSRLDLHLEAASGAGDDRPQIDPS